MILDNAKIQHAELIQPFLKEHKAWLFDAVQKIRKAVQGFIRTINETPAATVERLCLQF